MFFFFQAEDGIRDRSPSRGLGDVYKRQPFVFWKIQDTCLHHVPRKSTSLRYHRYAGGLLLQECFPAAGTVRTARADRRHCHRSGTLLEEKYASLRWRRNAVLHVSCSDNF